MKRKMKQGIFMLYNLSLMLVGFGVMGYCFGICASSIFDLKKDINFIFLGVFMLIVIYGTWTLTVCIHELGHVIFGLFSGYKFLLFRIGKVMIINTKDGCKMKKSSMRNGIGQCLMLPPENKGYDYPVLLYHYGGCIANVISVCISAIIYLLFKDNAIIQVLFFEFLYFGIYTVLTNGIPIMCISNDAYNGKLLCRNAKARKQVLHQTKILLANEEKKAVCKMPKEWFDWEMHIPENPFDFVSAILRFDYLLKCRCFEEMLELGEYLLENVQDMDKISVASIKFEILYCKIMLNYDKEDIRKIYETDEKLWKILEETLSINRIRYAYYSMIVPDKEKAHQEIMQFEKKIKKEQNLSEILSEKEQIHFIEKMITV